MIEQNRWLKIRISRGIIRLLLFTTLLLTNIDLTAQDKIVFIDQTNASNPVIHSFKFKSQSQFERKKLQLIEHKLEHDYIGFSIDSIISNKNILIYYNCGNPYHFTQSLNDISKKWQSSNLNLDFATTLQFKKDIVAYYQDNGYPNAQLYTKTTINDSTNTIHQEFTIQKGEHYFFSGFNNDKLNPNEINYLENICRIRPQKEYQQSKVNHIKQKINNSGIYKLDSLKLEYQKNLVSITPYLTSLKNNSINGWIGIQSNDDSETEITGNFDLSLINVLKQGEKVVLNWNKPKTESQELNAHFELPFILNLPVGIATSYSIDKEDTTYTNQNYELGVLFPIFQNANLIAYYSENKLQEHDTNAYKATQSLYGFTLSLEKTNQKILPQKGYSGNCDFNIGNHKDNNSQSLIINLEAIINLYIKLPVGGVHVGNQTGIIDNDSISKYEQFRIGGINSIRGFNERSIYCKRYTVFNLEYRIFFNNNSYIHVFYDNGFTNKISAKHIESLGSGLTITTQAGTLSLAYAIGKTNTSSFKLNQSLIHIGYAYIF